jgi:hypothetical protein
MIQRGLFDFAMTNLHDFFYLPRRYVKKTRLSLSDTAPGKSISPARPLHPVQAAFHRDARKRASCVVLPNEVARTGCGNGFRHRAWPSLRSAQQEALQNTVNPWIASSYVTNDDHSGRLRQPRNDPLKCPNRGKNKLRKTVSSISKCN